MKLFENISERERRLAVPLIMIVGFLIILIFIDLPFFKSGREAEKKAREEERRLGSIISTAQEYVSLKNEIEDSRARAFQGEGAALTGINSIANRAGLKKRLISLKPVVSPVADGMRRVRTELSFEKAALNEISGLVGFIESDAHRIGIEGISIKASYENPSLFNVRLTLNAAERE